MKIRVLGSGTSTGVPIPGCRCEVCRSKNSRNIRLRTSLFIELQSKDLLTAANTPDHALELAESVIGYLLIDTSPDLRYQTLREDISQIDAVLFTHTHADHVFGLDDLRSFNFINHKYIDCYASETSAVDLEHKFSYAFFRDPAYQGGMPPQLTLHRVRPYEALNLFGVEILPLPVFHGQMEVLGYRINNFAYVTDCSEIPEKTREELQRLDVLILDGLRHRPHRTHFTHAQAVAEIERIQPKQSYLTHLSHEIDHDEGNRHLATLTELAVELAYDGLTISL